LLLHRGSNCLLYRATGPKVSCCVAFKEKTKEKNLSMSVPYHSEKLVLKFMANRLLDLIYK